MQLSLYRAERPEVFEDIIGQKHIVRILQNQIRTGTVSQSYLFSGTRGTGKTSTARILAKALNCMEGEAGTESAVLEGDGTVPCGRCANCLAIRDGRFPDCIELDAASNNGVDDLRAIIDTVKYPPSLGRYKVYIIDEVHMLSTAAENAFLKTLEEPPEHAVFILATTDPQKVRQTIRSRCMQLNFRRVSEDELARGMERICRKRGIDITPDALTTIASRADGSVRDALSILEQCMAAGDMKLDRSLVLEYTGAAGDDFYIALTDAASSGDIGRALVYIDEIAKRGKDTAQILKDWLLHYRNLMIVKYVGRPERIIGSSAENISRLRKQAEALSIADIESSIRTISEFVNIGRYTERPRILLETAAVRIASGREAGSPVRHQTPGPAGGTGQTMPGRQRPEVKTDLQSGRAGMPAETSAASSDPVSGHGAKSTKIHLHSGEDNSLPAGDRSQVRAPDSDGRADNAYPDPVMPAQSRKLDAGDAEDMWNTISAEITRDDRSFGSFVGRHSRGISYDDGELIVAVKPGKMRLAEDKSGDINRMAKSLYGSEVFVTLRSIDPDEISEEAAAGSEQETARIIEDDVNINDIAKDIENVFGIKPEIIG